MALPFEHDARHTLVCDFETRCGLALDAYGAHHYVRHDTFRPLLLAARIGGERFLWECHLGPLPDRLRNIIADSTVSIASHGDFDRIVWKRLVEMKMLPEVKDRRWRDTMSIARANNLPPSLSAMAKALGLTTQKLEHGKAGIEKFSKPQRRKKSDPADEFRFIAPADDPDAWAQFKEYAVADVDVAWEALATLGFLSTDEEAVLRATRAMNDRGVPFSEERLRIIDSRAAEIKEMASAELRRLTGVTPGNPKAMRDWLNAEAGLGLETVRAQELAEAIADNELSDEVRKVIELRGIVGAKAVAKTEAALALGVPDQAHAGILRVFDQFIYAGASQTQRWSARGVQPQNLKRTAISPDAAEAAWDKLAQRPPVDGANLAGEMAQLAELMRSTITCPAGIAWTDLSNIELRVGAFVGANIVRARGGTLTGTSDLETSFRDKIDTYSHFAVDIYEAVRDSLPADQRIVVTPENAKKTGWRGTAKAVLLSSLYMVGKPTLQRNLRRDTGFEYSEAQTAGLHDAFRSRFPQFPAAWDYLKRAVLTAVRKQEPVTIPGFGAFEFVGKHLTIRKLSGSRVWYRNPRIDRYTRYGQMHHGFAFDAVANAGIVTDTPHAGTLLEHLVSSTSRDLVADAMVKAERAGLRLIMSVHDELVVEGGAAESAELHRIMGDAPDWASAWPLDRESTFAKAWGK